MKSIILSSSKRFSFLKHLSFCIPVILTTLFLSSCGDNAADTKKNYDDSVANVKRVQDSVKLVQDSIANAKAKLDTTNALAIMSLDLGDSTCEQIKNAINRDLIEDPIVYNEFIMKMIQCRNIKWNKDHPTDTRVTIVQEEEGKVLFNTLKASTAKDIADATKKIITAGAFVKSGGDPVITTVATVAGNYAVDAYVEAAAKNDPLIIILPTAVPNVKLAKDALHLTTDVYKAVSKIDPLKPYTIQVDGAKAVFVGAKAAANLAKDGAGKVVDATGKVINVIGDGAKAVEKIMPWHW